MHQNSEAKQPKETDEIKKKLESYAALHRRIDNQIERLENLEAVMGSISSPSFDGISGGGGDGTSKQERQVIQKVTLEETIRRQGLRVPEDIRLAVITIDPKQGTAGVAGSASELFQRVTQRLISVIQEGDDSVIQQWLPVRVCWPETGSSNAMHRQQALIAQ